MRRRSGKLGEESGTQFALDQTYDEVRAGARLILNYDASSNAFIGTVENTTSDILSRVRVEVHLSNGTELGPTTRRDIAPGRGIEITLAATEESFDSFSAHPEVGTGEHGGEPGDHQDDPSEHGAESGEHGGGSG